MIFSKKLLLLFTGLVFLTILMTLFSCKQPGETRQIIDLSGYWQFGLDTAGTGIADQWYIKDLTDSIELPGTTDLRQKGFLNTDTTTMHLNRIYRYQGPAWYRRKITIPEDFENKHIELILERTKSSMVWIDDHPAGGSKLLQTPQCYDLTKLLTPGDHTLTILVNNSLLLTPYGNVHIYSDDTQTNWNGIIGKIRLEISPLTHISDLQVYPEVRNNKFKVQLRIDNISGLSQVHVALNLKRISEGRSIKHKTHKHTVPADSVISLEYTFDTDIKLWDEYDRTLYELTAVISDGTSEDTRTVSFGMREFTTNGTQFSINRRAVFLRGKHDACVFPLTGFPPMDVEGWLKVFQKAKSYGINHYRFHSWCPPEAAFIAADLEGIYLQPELPFWGGLESDSVAAMLKAEGISMLRNYANHPSFVLFSHGNEIWSGHDRVEKNILDFKEFDNRPLYTMGSNNNIGYVAPRECSDFFVAARTPYAHDSILTHTRLTHAYADSRAGGTLNTQHPSTEIEFDYAVSQVNMPIIGHETGQYQVYPDYSEIENYKGVLRAWNLEVFRERLIESGMLDQNSEFQKASGAWSALCYKAEMEAALRTKGFGGFQLLDLQDFPGQGTALVGILNAFMEDKGVIDRNQWLQSCNDVVILLRFPKYCWTISETFSASVQVANYSERNLKDDLIWEVTDPKGNSIRKGEISPLEITNAGLQEVGQISIPLSDFKQASQLSLKVMLRNSGYSNSYPLWVYPDPDVDKIRTKIFRAEKLNKEVMSRLQNGEKVLLFPADALNNTVEGLFPPDFWNYGMFKGISEWVKKPVSPGTLSILTNPDHAIFGAFPTDFHTNWQWFSIIKESNPLILNQTDPKYRPIVQVIDNLERNHKLGLIFEFAVGKGKLLVCMSRLNEIPGKPEAFALYNSIINYMESDSFDPAYNIEEELLIELFK